MMSSSDRDGFKPLVVSSLEQFDEEQINRSDGSNPDFDRFELLFERPTFQDKEPYEFKMMVDAQKEEKTIVFKPLIKEGGKSGKTGRKTEASLDARGGETQETAEKKGYRKGFARGLEEGQKQGFEQGLESGEAKGIEIGKAQGFGQGEKQGFDHGVKAGVENGEADIRKKAETFLNSLEQSLKEADQTTIQIDQKRFF